MANQKKSTSSKNNNISISGDVKDSVVISGDHNTVNQTIIQKFFNIFKSDSETLEQRNRRILLGHVENAWIKGVLDASLHGAALLDLGIKQGPEAVIQYPWAIKKEATDETLPAGTSMLEIFDSIGMGRSLLILGAPGSGKTTMLLELARQLIAHAREDVTYPIPMVFNLASWTEKLSLADWLAQELNNLYSVPRKTAPDWVQGNKLLLLLDGLDEVRQESRAKCVEAINAFRKEHGLTSLAVCSRSQDYADLKAKLSFEGAIEVQPLTQGQITEFFKHFGKEMAGIKQVLKKDGSLREMAETPLFLSIMIMAYQDKQNVEILASGDEKARRKHLFDTYIERMFERSRSKNMPLKKQDVLHWLSWLAQKMIEHNEVPYLIENMQVRWVSEKRQWRYRLVNGLLSGMALGLTGGLTGSLIAGLISELTGNNLIDGLTLIGGLIWGLSEGLIVGLIIGIIGGMILNPSEIEMVDTLKWNWKQGGKGVVAGLIYGTIAGLIFRLILVLSDGSADIGTSWLIFGLLGGLSGGSFGGLISMLSIKPINQTTYSGQRILFSLRNFFFASVFIGLIFGLTFGSIFGLLVGGADSVQFFSIMFVFGLFGWLFGGLISGLRYGGGAVIQHFVLRLIVSFNNLLPWRLVPFLDHCVDLIFLRRVGGGYIFVHRLLMEHFAEMYVETPASKGN